MKIIYAQNPLRSVVVLEEIEIKLFRALYEKEHVEEALCSTFFSLQRGELKRALSRCTPYFMDEPDAKDRHREWMESCIESYLSSLSEPHCGDCTCFSASCTKCFIESTLGFSTIDGLGKHEANYIESAFRRENACSNGLYVVAEDTELPERSCDEALAHLEANPPQVKDSWQATHLERWIREHAGAIEWLKKNTGGST